MGETFLSDSQKVDFKSFSTRIPKKDVKEVGKQTCNWVGNKASQGYNAAKNWLGSWWNKSGSYHSMFEKRAQLQLAIRYVRKYKML